MYSLSPDVIIIDSEGSSCHNYLDNGLINTNFANIVNKTFYGNIRGIIFVKQMINFIIY